jgi:divalent metal cation (Fe/Co/Zn/Cd) transporter
MHVEVPSRQTLEQAHDAVSKLESDVANALPEINRVVTHIEPAQDKQSAPDDTRSRRRAAAIEAQADTLLNERYPAVGWHNLAARSVNSHGFALNLHATLPAQMSVEEAHDMAESAETLLRGAIPELARVTIHTEPFDHE